MNIVDKRKDRKYILFWLWNGLKKLKFTYIRLQASIIAGFLVCKVKNNQFAFNDKKLNYFYHPYNHTWVNERAIEIPIIKDILDKEKGQILEVGNVLQHYIPIKHMVLDKYEKFPGVINEDVVDFNLNKKFDLIVSISTMEHPGWDENPKDPEKLTKSIKNLKKHLKKDGKIIMTVPLGYNPYLDKLIKDKKVFQKVYFFERGIFGSWRQKLFNELGNKRYNYEITARVLALIIISN